MGRFDLAQAVAYMAAHPSAVTNPMIAKKAIELLRERNASGRDAKLGRPLVSMVRRGKTRGRRGIKVWAIWNAMHKLGLIPAVPHEVAEWGRLEGQRDHNRSNATYWRDRFYELEARSRRRGEQDSKEVPVLTAPMLRYFGFERNPVFDEIRSNKDVWWGSQHREAKSVLLEASEDGRFVRLAGRRGAGKSLVGNTVLEELKKRDDIIVVEPSAVITGVLTENGLVTSVIQSVKRKVDGRDEIFSEAQSPAKRALAMRYLLVQQKRANRKVVLWIDEAHELKAGTFLALKRFLDEVEGIGRRLLGIILIGQNPEAAYNPRARDLSEVTLRLQTYRIQPMHDEMGDYLRWKIGRAGATIADVITPSALKAVASRCPYPLDANVLFAQLLIDAYGDKKKPIGRDHVDAMAPEEGEAAEAI